MGKDEISGVTLLFGTETQVGLGGLGANSKYSKTHGFFETKSPYPTRIEFSLGMVATEKTVVIKDIKVVGQWRPNTPRQRLLVEIDSTNQTAVANVEIVPEPKK